MAGFREAHFLHSVEVHLRDIACLRLDSSQLYCQIHPCRPPPHPPIVIVLITVYSSVPYLLPSLPNPLCFTPPNGVAGSLINPVFTTTMPTSSASATLHIRPSVSAEEITSQAQ